MGQRLQCQGVGLLVLTRTAACGIRAKTRHLFLSGQVVQQGLGQDAAGRVVGAKKQNVEHGASPLGGVRNGVLWRTQVPVQATGASLPRHRLGLPAQHSAVRYAISSVIRAMLAR